MSEQSILYIDDEPEFSMAHHAALIDAGYHVTIAVNPDEAIAILQKNRFDLIILDLLMPPFKEDANDRQELVETGVKLHRKIRNDLRLKMPILFISVVRDQDITKRLRETEGAALNFLIKPVLPSMVVSEVKKLLKL